jgi:arylsulfatase A-like enzyme
MITGVPTLADILRDKGYATHAVGKWHLGFCKQEYLPTSRGFDHHYGFWNGAQDYFSHILIFSGFCHLPKAAIKLPRSAV